MKHHIFIILVLSVSCCSTACTRTTDSDGVLTNIHQDGFEEDTWLESLGLSTEQIVGSASANASIQNRYVVLRRESSILLVRRTYYELDGYESLMAPNPWRFDLSSDPGFSGNLLERCSSRQLSTDNCGNDTRPMCTEEVWEYKLPKDFQGHIWYRVSSGWFLANTSSPGGFEKIIEKSRAQAESDELPIALRGSFDWP